MKKKIFAICVIVFCLAIASSSTIAYFTADDIAHNVITTGNIDIAIVEYTVDENGVQKPFPTEGFFGVMPGSTVSKIVAVDNTSNAPAWVRVKVIQTITSANGETMSNVLTDGNGVITLDINTESWIYGDDGYYYYSTPITADEVTDALFTSVYFSTGMNNIYQDCTASIHIYAQAVQSTNNPAPADGNATDVAGWPTEDIG